MTVIAYYRNTLLADCLHIYEQESDNSFVVMGKKLHLSPERQIAFASCGTTIHEKDLEQVTQWLLNLMEELEKSNQAPEITDQIKSTYLCGRTFLVMSKNFCLSLAEYSEGLLGASDTVAYGSGRMSFLTAAAVDLPTDKIVPFVATMVGNVSSGFTLVEQASLSAFTFPTEASPQ